MSIKERLWELSEQAADNVTQLTGHMQVSDAESELSRLVDLDPCREELHEALRSAGCKGEIRKLGERHRPKWNQDGSFAFNPRDIWKLGGGLWVRAELATRVDGIATARQSTRNRGQVDSADDRLQQYMAERQEAFRLNPEIVTFGDLERIHFGYTGGSDGGPDRDVDQA
ncbi:hypothetical protein ACFVVU_30600 [Kitasatospora sp. NPDC057965]|uniref:hypothetical protein n=1 Tax=Kitasatospora sp. NPDC057965 TaxID=3346291 RepID=UPI0036DB506D